MQIGELVATVFLETQLNEDCPFKVNDTGPLEEDIENIEKDDRDTVLKEQANNGGTLGENLTSGSPGSSKTIGGPFTAEDRDADLATDTKRTDGKVNAVVPGTDLIEEDKFPFIQSAHHIIPGKASLVPSELYKFMQKGESVDTDSGGKFNIICHIGYNVNGSHNGIWLAGNYAIRSKKTKWNKTPVKGKKWSGLEALHSDWQMNYVAAVCKATGRQFHDAHREYNDSSKQLLNKIAAVLFAHQSFCDDCKSKKDIPPPYLIKERFYNISTYLKTQLMGPPIAWKRPWMTSDRWRDEAFLGAKIKGAFVDAYEKSKKIEE